MPGPALITNNFGNTTYASATTINAQTCTFTQALGTGNTILGNVVMANGAGGVPTITVSDSKGNTYTVDKSNVFASNLMEFTFSAPVTVAVTTSDFLTVTLGAGVKRPWWGISLQAFSGILQSAYIDVSNSGQATSTAVNSGSTGTMTQASNVVYGGVGYANGKTFTLGGSGFTSGAEYTLTGSTTDKAMRSIWKIVNATTAQTIQGTLNSSGSWTSNVVVYKAGAVNQAPTANAGPDQSSIGPGVTVTLDGTASSDPEGSVTYAWSQTNGPSVTLSSSTASQPTFTAPTQSSSSTLTFQLIVTDTGGLTATDTVDISVNGTGVSSLTRVGSTLATGTATTCTITLSSAVSAGHSVIVSLVTDDGPNTDPTITASDTRGNTWTQDNHRQQGGSINLWHLHANVGTALHVGDVITINIGENRTRFNAFAYDIPNMVSSTPVDKINAGGNGTGTALSSGATGALAQANEVVFGSFAVTQTSGGFSGLPGGWVLGDNQITAAGSSDREHQTQWFFPSATTSVTSTQTIGTSRTWAAEVTTYKLSTSAVPPVANAGPNQTVYPFDLVTLTGAASTATSPAVVSGYAWTQTSGTTATLSNAAVVSPTFTAPASVSTQTLVFRLIVTDSNGSTSPASTVTITILPAVVRWANTTWVPMQRKTLTGGSWVN